jgi:hypothetical protein
MKGIERRSDKRVEWREGKSQDELRAGSQILATLRWEGWLSKRAFAASPEGQWVFDRPALLSRDVKVWVAEQDEPVAVLEVGWLGDGTLKLADGRSLRWISTNFWRTRWSFTTPAGDPLVSLADNSGFLERRTVIEHVSPDLSASDRGLLLLLGRYLMVLQAEDAAAAAAVGGAVTATM